MTASGRRRLMAAAAIAAAVVSVGAGVLLATARQPDTEVRYDELGAVNLIEVVGGDPERVEAAVADAGGEVVEVLDPGPTRDRPVTRALFNGVHDRDEQRAVITRLESDGLTARPAMVSKRNG